MLRQRVDRSESPEIIAEAPARIPEIIAEAIPAPIPEIIAEEIPARDAPVFIEIPNSDRANLNDEHEVIENEPSDLFWDTIHFLISFVNFSRYILPITTRRIKFWIAYLILGGSLALLQIKFDIFGSFYTYLENGNDIGLSIFLTGLEPILLFWGLMASQYSRINWMAEAEKQFKISNLGKIFNTRESHSKIPLNYGVELLNEGVAVVVPVYQGEVCLLIENLLHSFRPEQIFLMINGCNEEKAKKLIKIISKYDGVRPYWVKDIANKTIPQLVGAQIAIDLGYEFILTIDDDTGIQEGFIFPKHLFKDPLVIGVCLDLAAISGNSRKKNLITDLQMTEYRLHALQVFREKHGNAGGVSSIHGAGSCWRAQEFLDIMGETHNVRFHGEDCLLALSAIRAGKKIEFYNDFSVETIVPQKWMELIKQRQKSWDAFQNWQFLFSLFNFFTTHKNTLWGTLQLKISQAYCMLSVAATYLRLPVCIAKAKQVKFWAWSSGMHGLYFLAIILWNYWKLKNRKDLQIPFKAIVLYPFYTIFRQIVSVFSIPYTWGVFAPLLPDSVHYKKMIKKKTLDISNIVKISKKLLRIYKKDERLSTKYQKRIRSMIYVPAISTQLVTAVYSESDDLTYDEEIFFSPAIRSGSAPSSSLSSFSTHPPSRRIQNFSESDAVISSIRRNRMLRMNSSFV